MLQTIHDLSSTKYGHLCYDFDSYIIVLIINFWVWQVHCIKMAEKVVQKLENQLNCSICLDTYTNPKLLQCFHVYCKECLVRLVDQDQRGQLSLVCPNCRQATPVPDTGVSGLQSAFHINHFLEIVEEHKKEKDTAIAETTEGVTTGVTLQQQSSHCTEHVDEELKLYCETCSKISVSVPSGASITAMITSQSVMPLRSTRKKSILSWTTS